MTLSLNPLVGGGPAASTAPRCCAARLQPRRLESLGGARCRSGGRLGSAARRPALSCSVPAAPSSCRPKRQRRRPVWRACHDEPPGLARCAARAGPVVLPDLPTCPATPRFTDRD